MGRYSGYNRIPLAEEDQERMMFIKEERLYCCKVMLFGLKNTRAIYQLLVDNISKDSIRVIVEAY